MFELYDSLEKKVLPFKPADGEFFRIYACGPTVYKDLTIGNWRTFLTVDLLRRYAEYSGYGVKLVMNVTDVGHMLNDADTGVDKLEASAKEEGKTPWEIADTYTESFFRDLTRIGFKQEGTEFPRATSHIKEMVAMIETLLKKDLAYRTDNGDVYFDITKAEHYGRLSGNTIEDLKAGARVDVNADKRNPGDFALWIHNPQHVMQWPGPNGADDKPIQGYPGWHIECSAMSTAYLGPTLDLHIGGEDLKFPHHECEIAQSEGATGKTFSKHWLHVKYLMVHGDKMSKSKGNFFTLSDILAKGYKPEALRYLLLSAQYRTPLNFTFKGLDEATEAVRRFQDLARALKSLGHENCVDAHAYSVVDEARRKFEESMDDDLSVSGALAALHELTRNLNKAMAENNLGPDGADAALCFLELVDKVFGFGMFHTSDEEIPVDVRILAADRATARAEKRWNDADRLRQALLARGYDVMDTPKGQELRKK